MQNKDDEKELFISVKDVPGGSNGNIWLAIAGATLVGIVGVLFIAGLGIKGGIVTVITALLAITVFKAIRNSANNTR